MKFNAIALATAILATGCSTFSGSNDSQVENSKTTAISEQRLSTNFRKEGIKIEWTMLGNLKAIEVTGYASANGNTEFQQEAAFDAAELEAKAKLQRFLREGITSSKVMNTMVKNVEKAHDVTRNKIKNTTDQEVTMSDTDAANTTTPKTDEGETNYAIRDNANYTTRTVIKKISEEASGIQSGVFIKETDVMSDKRTVKVVLRWDRDSEKAVKELRKAFR
jgi:hypothetical protein